MKFYQLVMFHHSLIYLQNNFLVVKKKLILLKQYRKLFINLYNFLYQINNIGYIYRSLLNIDEIQCVHIWNSYLRGFVLDGKQKFDSLQFKSLDTIIQVRDFYFTQLQYTWKILQELIRIHGDSSHVYYESVTEYILKLLDRFNLIDIIIFIITFLSFILFYLFLFIYLYF